MKQILITGGPVHGKLDDVKLVTNRFKGGLMALLAADLAEKHDVHITYITPKGGILPMTAPGKLTIIYHDGFFDYQQKVLELAPSMDAVILGGAVANLIPEKPFPGKFPSHNYKPGDIIPINFMIAPRVVDQVKKAAPKTHLFAFKLLSNASHDELISAAYHIVTDSKATAVFANDTADLKTKYAVTKEGGTHKLDISEYAEFIWEAINDVYYHSEPAAPEANDLGPNAGEHQARALLRKYAYDGKFPQRHNGLIFGTVAVRNTPAGTAFTTTGRGKNELESFAVVKKVDHTTHTVFVQDGRKASLNAPLLAAILENHAVDHIVHFHEQTPNLPTLPYAPPGTVRDTARGNNIERSFNIDGHGTFLLFDAQNNRIG